MTSLKIPKAKAPDVKVKGAFLQEFDKTLITERRKEKLTFSFYFFDRSHQAFNCGGIGCSWHISLLDTLAEVSKLNWDEFIKQRQHYDVHPHDWDKVEYEYTLPADLMEQIREDSCYQFRISKSTGRVHGWVVGNRFYIVWLDPHHNMNPDERFGGTKFFEPPLSEYDLLKIEHERLKQEYDDFVKSLDDATAPDKESQET